MFSIQRIIGGLCIFTGAQFLVTMLYLESIVPGFDRTINYISDLGVGSTALAFNSSIFFTGVLAIISAILLFYYFKKTAFSIVLILTGVSMMLVGIFPENIYPTHLVVSFTTFLFGGIVAIISSSKSKKYWSQLFVLLGIISLVVLALDTTSFFTSWEVINLGDGIVERLIVYPFIIWAILFGVYLFVEKKSFDAF